MRESPPARASLAGFVPKPADTSALPRAGIRHAGRNTGLSADRRTVRLDIPPVRLTGHAMPLHLHVDCDAKAVDQIHERLTVLRRARWNRRRCGAGVCRRLWATAAMGSQFPPPLIHALVAGTTWALRCRAAGRRTRELVARAMGSLPRGQWWALQGSNLGPHPCGGCALPLSQAPDARLGPRHDMRQRAYSVTPAGPGWALVRGKQR